MTLKSSVPSGLANPVLALTDAPDALVGHFKLFREGSYRLGTIANSVYVCFRKIRFIVGSPHTLSSAATKSLHAVTHVICVIPQIKMFRVNAFRIVTFMKAMHAQRNVSIMQNPRRAVRLLLAVRAPEKVTASITLLRTFALPFPTAGRLLQNFLHEFLNHKRLILNARGAVK